jgi:hypothetical protein
LTPESHESLTPLEPDSAMTLSPVKVTKMSEYKLSDQKSRDTVHFMYYRVKPGEEVKMPFWKKDKETEAKGKEKEGGKEARGKEKVNYKARLEHKQYLVSC